MATTTADTTAGTAQGRPSVDIPAKRISASQIEELAKRVVCAGDREMTQVEQPFTGKPLGWVPKNSPEDVDAAFERARAAQREWRKTSFAERRAILLRFHDLVMERQDELLDLLQIEGGKARRHAYEEALDVAIVARYYANTAETHLKTKRRRGVIPFLTATWEHHHPLGVVGIIAPWNYPITLSVSDAVPALAAGNGVVCKPDSQTPFSALWAFALLAEPGPPARPGGFARVEGAGLAGGLVQVVAGSGSELGPPIIDAADYMMFTGSTAVGRTVA